MTRHTIRQAAVLAREGVAEVEVRFTGPTRRRWRRGTANPGGTFRSVRATWASASPAPHATPPITTAGP
jgi:hypothetical protein